MIGRISSSFGKGPMIGRIAIFVKKMSKLLDYLFYVQTYMPKGRETRDYLQTGQQPQPSLPMENRALLVDLKTKPLDILTFVIHPACFCHILQTILV